MTILIHYRQTHLKHSTHECQIEIIIIDEARQSPQPVPPYNVGPYRVTPIDHVRFALNGARRQRSNRTANARQQQHTHAHSHTHAHTHHVNGVHCACQRAPCGQSIYPPADFVRQPIFGAIGTGAQRLLSPIIASEHLVSASHRHRAVWWQPPTKTAIDDLYAAGAQSMTSHQCATGVIDMQLNE